MCQAVTLVGCPKMCAGPKTRRGKGAGSCNQRPRPPWSGIPRSRRPRDGTRCHLRQSFSQWPRSPTSSAAMPRCQGQTTTMVSSRATCLVRTTGSSPATCLISEKPQDVEKRRKPGNARSPRGAPGRVVRGSLPGDGAPAGARRCCHVEDVRCPEGRPHLPFEGHSPARGSRTGGIDPRPRDAALGRGRNAAAVVRPTGEMPTQRPFQSLRGRK